MLCTNHHWEHLCVRWCASPLATYVEENRTGGFVEKFIIVPIPLLVDGLVLVVEVVNLVLKVVCGVILHRNL